MNVLQNHVFMTRGGRREGAGRKSAWKHRETTVIRVPKVFADQLLEIAQKLDRGEYLDFVSESNGFINRVVSSVGNDSDAISESPGQMSLLQLEDKTEDSFDFATKSKSHTNLSVKAHSGRALARRLGVGKNVVIRRREKPEFEHWARDLDPDKLGWRYDSSSKRYYPVF